MKPSSDRDELCYPFLYEDSARCDYEIITDELCKRIGLLFAMLPDGMDDLRADFECLQPMAFHLNGSVRGALAVSDEDLQWLRDRYHHYQRQIAGRVQGFVLPRGSVLALELQLTVSTCKKAIRLLGLVAREGRPVADVLHRYLNLLGNFFFVASLVVNQRQGATEVPFVSKSYGTGAQPSRA